MLSVVLADEVQYDRAGLPDGKVTVGVVDERRQAAVGVDFGERWLLLLLCLPICQCRPGHTQWERNILVFMSR